MKATIIKSKPLPITLKELHEGQIMEFLDFPDCYALRSGSHLLFIYLGGSVGGAWIEPHVSGNLDRKGTLLPPGTTITLTF